jgi:magnesium transporter
MITGRIYREGQPDGEPLALDPEEPLARETGVYVWIDAVDPDPADLGYLERAFGLHPVTIEDAEHRRQRTKVELFESYAVIVLRPVTLLDPPVEAVAEHEVHAIAGADFLVTLRWSPAYPLDAVMARWQRRADLHGAGFALYVLLDEVVDDYLSAIEVLEDEADALEDVVFERDDGERGSDVQERLFRLKRSTVVLRRSAAPLRHGIDMLQEEPMFASPGLAPYYRDVMDHVIRVAEMADNVRDLLTSLLEVRVAQAANRLNEAMKKMTAWAGIVLVPTLIAGIYGMNFRGMPELRWQFGYPMALGLMAGAAIGLYVSFKKRGWL